MKKKDDPYYLNEMDIVHHIASVFHVIPNGNISGRPDFEPLFRTAETPEDFEFIYNREYKKLKFKDLNLYLSLQINEFEQRVIELERFDSHTFSEDIQLIHDYLNYLKGKEKKQVNEISEIPSVNVEQGIDEILRGIFPKISDTDFKNLPKPLRELKENLQGQTHNLSQYSLVYVGKVKPLENELKKFRNLEIDRKTTKYVFEKWVTRVNSITDVTPKQIRLNNHI